MIVPDTFTEAAAWAALDYDIGLAASEGRTADYIRLCQAVAAWLRENARVPCNPSTGESAFPPHKPGDCPPGVSAAWMDMMFAWVTGASEPTPDEIWGIRVSRITVGSVWQPAEKSGLRHSRGSMWRVDTEGAEIALVCPSSHPAEPDIGGYSLGDDEEYAKDLAAWRSECAAMRPWSIYLYTPGPHPSDVTSLHLYADTPEEAMALADAKLQEAGVLLSTCTYTWEK